MTEPPIARYFAFGSNLHRASWAAYCAEHGADPDVLVPGPAAWLPDHAAVYHYRSMRNAGGALDVVPRLGHAVPGRLFAVKEGGWSLLDVKEGHPRRYARRDVWVVDVEGHLRRATTYAVTEARREGRFVAPTTDYARRVREGLRDAGHRWEDADRLAGGGAVRSPVRAVFAYGTLKRGQGAAHRLAALAPRRVEPGTIPGSLYDLGAYPGLDPACRLGVVHGEVAFFDDPGPVVDTLDRYEDFGGWGRKDNLYHRVVVPASTSDGETHLAWAYALSSRPDAPRVPGGRWSANTL